MIDIEELLYANELHMEQLMKARLDELDFTPDTLRILKGRGIVTLGHLTERSREDLLGIKFLGKERVDGIEAILEKYDLQLRQSRK